MLRKDNTSVDKQMPDAHQLGEYFFDVTRNIRANIPESNKKLYYYLENSTRNTFYFTPITINEIILAISSLKNKKSVEADVIPVFLIKAAANIMAAPIKSFGPSVSSRKIAANGKKKMERVLTSMVYGPTSS